MTPTPTILHVVGARPNFMKTAPLLRALGPGSGLDNVLVHTGQHYDEAMSASFFRELDIPEPTLNLGVGSGSHIAQMVGVMSSLEPVLADVDPAVTVVVGDVNSTLAAALAAAKAGVPVAHVEAGLRSGDRSMPEELNRLLTDQLSELLFAPSRGAVENLAGEGIARDRIRFVGNIMMDTLVRHLSDARDRRAWRRFDVEPGAFGVVTLHRPSNVDDPGILANIVRALEEIASDMPLLLPLHPRTRGRMSEAGLKFEKVRALPPLNYLDMLSLMDAAAVVMTDSGGIQEETTFLGIPCLTLRDTTERPVTVEEGTNRLVPARTSEAILAAFHDALDYTGEGGGPELWDGRTAERIAEALREFVKGSG